MSAEWHFLVTLNERLRPLRDPVEIQSVVVQLIAEHLQALPQMQRQVLALYYFEDMRLRDIAEIFGLTESRICQIHSQAILAMRAHLSTYCEV